MPWRRFASADNGDAMKSSRLRTATPLERSGQFD
jgi:hypothetical protein